MAEAIIQQVDVAPIQGTLVVIEPPEVAVDPKTGRVDQIVAGYISDDFETIPVGKVTTEPFKTIVRGYRNSVSHGIGSQVKGVLGDRTVFEGISPHAIDGREVSDSYLILPISGQEQASVVEELRKEATSAVLARLGLTPPKEETLSRRLLGLLRRGKN